MQRHGEQYPLGAVITRRAIAGSLEKKATSLFRRRQSRSLHRQLTVLDILRTIAGEMPAIGDHPQSGLAALMFNFPIIGPSTASVFLGLELIRDHDHLTPATERRHLQRLLDLGVIMQPTDVRNVLKIKPPLCLSIETVSS